MKELDLTCCYATKTNKPWGACACVVVECRAPQAQEDARALTWRNFKGFDGARFATDNKLNVITDSDHIERRERFCNASCKYYKYNT